MTEKVLAEKWDKAYSGVHDDEMPFTPERISLVMNFVNDHFPDFDTPKEFEDMITEYTDWETELGEAEDKLEAVKEKKKEYCSLKTCEGCGMDGCCFPQAISKILEGEILQTSDETGDKDE